MDHTSLLRDAYAPSESLSRNMVGFEDCESLFTNPKTQKMIAEKCLARHFLNIRQALGQGELGNVF